MGIYEYSIGFCRDNGNEKGNYYLGFGVANYKKAPNLGSLGPS